MGAAESESLELAVNHYALKANLRCVLHEKLGEAVSMTRSPLRSSRLPFARPQPALDHLAIDALFSRNPFDSPSRVASAPPSSAPAPPAGPLLHRPAVREETTRSCDSFALPSSISGL